jgi:hypothetical protein
MEGKKYFQNPEKKPVQNGLENTLCRRAKYFFENTLPKRLENLIY